MRTMTSHFVNQMNRIARVFGDAVIKPDRIARFWEYGNELPDDAVVEFVDGVVDGSKFAPVPKDLREFKREWRIRNPEIRGDAPDTIDCLQCYDSGFSWVDYDDDPVWIFCLCKAGLNSMEKHRLVLPRPTRDQMAALRPRTFPVDHFIPTSVVDDELSVTRKAFAKWEEWRKDLKSSERYWKRLQETI